MRVLAQRYLVDHSSDAHAEVVDALRRFAVRELRM
jgi:hypothetical protein